jgi:hypothetical protein
VSEPIKISERQRRCLMVLGPHYFPGEERCLYFRTIAKETDLREAEVRKAVRALARKGLAEYHRGLFTEDGEAAGSGYCCTAAGFALYQSLLPAEPKAAA